MSSSNSNKKIILSEKTLFIIDRLCSVLFKLLSNNKKIMENTIRTHIANHPLDLTSNTININDFFKKTSFDINSSPTISFKDYLVRVVHYSKISDNTIISCLILLDKFLNKTGIQIYENNLFLLVLTGLQIAMKINEDVILRDCDYAFLGMISSKTLAYNESLFLQAIDFCSHIKTEEFACYYNLFQ